ncbi:MAG TPA: serine/threonine-protein kinase, partial [Polyangiaceae bacterium]|nr:serine/threonine-protein kinase [Polyangiaceae bacterium]
MALEVGQLVTPSLRIVQRLGAGGMGSVWIADHLTLHTQVVVKIMSVELANKPEAVARFKAEASAAAKVKSPHVVQMLDHGIAEDGSPYIVMELLEGADLRSFFRAGSLNRKQIVSVVIQVAKALGKAHESGVIHRDIKPGNIFLCTGDGDHFVKILDFGIAKLNFPGDDGGHTQTGMMIGSPPFMSPEQLRGDKALDHRADLWSLAVVLFQGLTKKRPFEGDSVAELAVAIHTPPPPRASALDPTLPPALDEWFAKAFAQQPKDRFQSARELAEALEEAMSGVPTGSAMGSV